MAWQDQVPGGFGAVDGKFAVHPKDAARAKAAIKEAKTAGASFDDFSKEMVWHLWKAGADRDHIEAQLSVAKKLW